MEEWRVINDPPLTGALNMGIDCALMDSLSRGECIPTLRIYQWKNPAITLGYFQVVEDELDSAACRREGVDYIRRITGGGAVFHEHEITYSIVVSAGDRRVRGSIGDSYRTLCEPIVKTLRNYSINAVFRPINDIHVKEKKISGSAQTRRKGVILQHGTILMEVNADKMFGLLKISKGKQGAESLKERVTSLKDILGDRAQRPEFADEFRNNLIYSWEESLGVKLVAGSLSQSEHHDALQWKRLLFSNRKWNEERKWITG